MASRQALKMLLKVNKVLSNIRFVSQTAQRSCSTEALRVPTADGAPEEYPANITGIVDQISKLTLLEVSQLNSCLKMTLNISDAPMMPMMGMTAPAQAAEEEEETKPQIQSLFSVRLDKFDDTKKVALIKEVKKHMEGLNLVQAKKFVEGCPGTVKEGLSREEAEALCKTLEGIGATTTIE